MMRGSLTEDGDLMIQLSPIPVLDGSIPAEFFGPTTVFSESGSINGPWVGQLQFNLTAYIKWLSQTVADNCTQVGVIGLTPGANQVHCARSQES